MFGFFIRYAAVLVAGTLSLAWTPAQAGPMAVQETFPVGIEQQLRPTIRPLYESSLDTAYTEQNWRDSRAIGQERRPEVPTGIIASIGRLGLAVDSSDGGPKIKGVAWSLNRSTSVIAGGNLGAGGLGASLTVRLSF